MISQLLSPLIAMMGLATGVWLLSLIRRDVSLIDSFWGLFFLLAAGVWALDNPLGPRAPWVFGLLILWALRLSIYLTVRNWGQAEDRRYQAIRARNQPHYEIKSLFVVFYLQVLLALLVALPIAPALTGTQALGPLDGLGIAVFLLGFGIETVADEQMRRYKARKDPEQPVMNRGLWAWCRHPNYFGESLLWWGFFILAWSAGAPLWMVFSPLFMTFLLVRVSGIPLLEKDLKNRHPAYRRYMEETPSFLPGWRRR